MSRFWNINACVLQRRLMEYMTLESVYQLVLASLRPWLGRLDQISSTQVFDLIADQYFW